MKGYGFDEEQRFSEEEWLPRNFGDDLPRPAPTPEEKEKMRKELLLLGGIFRGYRRRWQIDGSWNICLRNRTGETDVFHRDVDISLFEKDIFFLEEYLLRRSYGLFLYRKEAADGCFFRIFKRVKAADFIRSEKWQLRIASISDDSKVRLDADLVFIDVALINERRESRFFGWLDVPFPDRWLSYKKAIVFADAVVIYLSHPARFLLSKLFFFRRSDEDDLKDLMSLRIITLRDLDDIEKIFRGIWETHEDRISLEMKNKIAARIEAFRAFLQ